MATPLTEHAIELLLALTSDMQPFLQIFAVEQVNSISPQPYDTEQQSLMGHTCTTPCFHQSSILSSLQEYFNKGLLYTLRNGHVQFFANACTLHFLLY